MAGQVYLLSSTTYRRRPLFADQALGRVVLDAISHHGAKGQTTNFAYVVMPDHFHWLLALGEGVTLAKIMASVKGYSSRAIKQMAMASLSEGPLWQEGYHDHALRREEDVLAVARYVVANPLRAGLTRRLADYPLWGSQYPEEFAGMCLE